MQVPNRINPKFHQLDQIVRFKYNVLIFSIMQQDEGTKIL
jgi:hypothetical protein